MGSTTADGADDADDMAVIVSSHSRDARLLPLLAIHSVSPGAAVS